MAAGFDLEWIVQTAFAVEAVMGAYYAVFFLALIFTTDSDRKDEAITTSVILAAIYVGLGYFCNRQLGSFLTDLPDGDGGGLPENGWDSWWYGWIAVMAVVVGGGLLTRWLLLGPLLPKSTDDNSRENQITAAFQKNELVVWGLLSVALALPFAYIWVKSSRSNPASTVSLTRKERIERNGEDDVLAASRKLLELLGK